MLDNLTSRLGKIIENVTGRYRLSESNINDVLKKIRKSLLEADVSWEIIKLFIHEVKKKCINMEVSRKLSPGNLLIKIVYDELVKILSSGDKKKFIDKAGSPVIILIVGLQGAGKTTTVVKLARWIKTARKKTVSVVSCDIYRAAAREQLKILADEADIECFSCNSNNIEFILKNSLKTTADFLIVDSAGRLHIDNIMMEEIIKLNNFLNPSEVLLVVDGMVGQDAMKSVTVFNEKLPISGFILTKMDGDARGGVVLTLSYTTGKPIRFIGLGEKTDAFEVFYAERIVSRILGMGDLSGLMEDVNNKLDKEKVDLLVKKVSEQKKMDLEDFRIQLVQIVKMGGISNMMKKIPGMNSISSSVKKKVDDKYFFSMISIINSMTHREKKFSHLLNGSRKRRIAKGSGVDVQSVNRLLKQYNIMQKMLGKYSNKTSMMEMLKNKFSLFNKINK